ncbi:MAG: hypothetical protein HFI90_04735 [Clostridia bacterium]|nr:hypothetical protein [Clostridia bacterium]
MKKKDFALQLAAMRTKKNVSSHKMSLAMRQNQRYITHIEARKCSLLLTQIVTDYFNIIKCYILTFRILDYIFLRI